MIFHDFFHLISLFRPSSQTQTQERIFSIWGFHLMSTCVRRDGNLRMLVVALLEATLYGVRHEKWRDFKGAQIEIAFPPHDSNILSRLIVWLLARSYVNSLCRFLFFQFRRLLFGKKCLFDKRQKGDFCFFFFLFIYTGENPRNPPETIGSSSHRECNQNTL